MFSSKIIKTICYIIISIACLAAVILIVVGANFLADREKGAWIYIACGILLPFLSIVWVFPIFALANIDINVVNMKTEMESLNKKVDQIDSCSSIKNEENCKENSIFKGETHIVDENPIRLANSKVDVPQKELNRNVLQTNIYKESLNFINKKYGVNISEDDDVGVVKEKIESIEYQTTSFAILKNKIRKADGFSEIANAIIMHKTANDNNR